MKSSGSGYQKSPQLWSRGNHGHLSYPNHVTKVVGRQEGMTPTLFQHATTTHGLGAFRWILAVGFLPLALRDKDHPGQWKKKTILNRCHRQRRKPIEEHSGACACFGQLQSAALVKVWATLSAAVMEHFFEGRPTASKRDIYQDNQHKRMVKTSD
ncbi:hypothetical protein ACWF50_11055 [Brucella pseudogrignonensis]